MAVNHRTNFQFEKRFVLQSRLPIRRLIFAEVFIIASCVLEKESKCRGEAKAPARIASISSPVVCLETRFIICSMDFKKWSSQYLSPADMRIYSTGWGVLDKELGMFIQIYYTFIILYEHFFDNFLIDFSVLILF